jgi:hypothetical protein
MLIRIRDGKTRKNTDNVFPSLSSVCVEGTLAACAYFLKEIVGGADYNAEATSEGCKYYSYFFLVPVFVYSKFSCLLLFEGTFT